MTEAAKNQGELDINPESAETEAETVTTVDTEAEIRESIEDDIAARLERQRKAESDEPEAETPEATTAEAKEAEAETKAETETPEKPAEPAETKEQTEQPESVLVKVEGQQYSVPKSAVDEAGGIEAFQKRAAADLIFRRAKEREDAANKLLAQARDPAMQQAAQQTQHAQDTSQQDQVAELIEKARFEGDPRLAADAIRKLVGQQNPLTREDISSIVLERISQNEAVARFKTNYKDIVDDPVLLGMAAKMENDLIASGRRDYDNIFSDIGKAITGWKEKLVKGSTTAAGVTGGLAAQTSAATTGTATFDAKKEKKSNIVNIPQAKAKAVLPEEQREPTASEIIEEERKARTGGK